MTRAAERDRERGAHPAGADDTHPQPGRVLARSRGIVSVHVVPVLAGTGQRRSA
jgi:hypothetical protein